MHWTTLVPQEWICRFKDAYALMYPLGTSAHGSGITILVRFATAHANCQSVRWFPSSNDALCWIEARLLTLSTAATEGK
ncbi:MAG: hypothetical protein NVS4B8_07970 [Herpetosiphon sp.]